MQKEEISVKTFKTQAKRILKMIENRDNNGLESNPFKLSPLLINIRLMDNANTLLHELAKIKWMPSVKAIQIIMQAEPNPFFLNDYNMSPRMVAEMYGQTRKAAFLAAYEQVYSQQNGAEKIQECMEWDRSLKKDKRKEGLIWIKAPERTHE